jgi:hypothetical protein
MGVRRDVGEIGEIARVRVTMSRTLSQGPHVAAPSCLQAENDMVWAMIDVGLPLGTGESFQYQAGHLVL